MKRKIFDENLITSISKPLDSSYMSNAYGYMCECLEKSISNIMKRRPIINDFGVEIVNECKNYAEGENSSLDIFVKIQAPTLELNCYNLNKNFFKKVSKKFINAWRIVKSEKKKSKRKRKKERDKAKNEENTKIITNYTLLSLKVDVVNELANYFTDETFFSIFGNSIFIYSRDELGVNINLYFVFGMEGEYKLFNTTTYKLSQIDFKDRTQNFDKKHKEIGENYISILRIINELFNKIIGHYPNQILIESILYNLPNELFEGENIYDIFICIINYINFNLNNLLRFKSIIDQNETIENQVLCKIDFPNFISFVKKIVVLI